MTRDGLVSVIRKKCREAGSQAAAAEGWGVAPAYVSDVLSGRREPGPRFLRALGYRRVVTYEPIIDPCSSGGPEVQRSQSMDGANG